MGWMEPVFKSLKLFFWVKNATHNFQIAVDIASKIKKGEGIPRSYSSYGVGSKLIEEFKFNFLSPPTQYLEALID